MRRRAKAAIAVIASLVWLATIAGMVALNSASDASVATLGGCPSKALHLPPGSKLHQFSVISVGTTAGCWASYDQPESASENDVFNYFLDPTHMPGWDLQEAYASTHYAAFRNDLDSQVQADVEVTTLRAFFVAGPSAIRLDVSVCRCDPRTMAQ